MNKDHCEKMQQFLNFLLNINKKLFSEQTPKIRYGQILNKEKSEFQKSFLFLAD